MVVFFVVAAALGFPANVFLGAAAAFLVAAGLAAVVFFVVVVVVFLAAVVGAFLAGAALVVFEAGLEFYNEIRKI